MPSLQHRNICPLFCATLMSMRLSVSLRVASGGGASRSDLHGQGQAGVLRQGPQGGANLGGGEMREAESGQCRADEQVFIASPALVPTPFPQGTLSHEKSVLCSWHQCDASQTACGPQGGHCFYLRLICKMGWIANSPLQNFQHI